MHKIIFISIVSFFLAVGCGKKPQPTPEEIIPEIPEPLTVVDETNDQDLSNVVVPVNNGDGVAVEVSDGTITDTNTDAVEASLNNNSDLTDVNANVEGKNDLEEVVVETQVVVDPIQDLDEIVPDSVWTEYMIKPGQTLSLIAYEEYGNPNEWRTIYGWNKEKIGEDPDMIHPYHYLDLLKPSENSVEFEPDYYIHRVTRGETLWTIAKKEYGDQYAWVVLYWDNEALLQENDGVLKPGMELKVRTELWPEF